MDRGVGGKGRGARDRQERFAVEPAEPRDAHRPLPKRVHLEALFAETRTRTVREDFTIRNDNRRLQIPTSQARGVRPGHKLTIELGLDGSPHSASSCPTLP